MPFFDSFEQMVDAVDLDGVIIGLPGHLHMEATLKALDAGLPVLCEKPPTDDADQMRRVRDKVAETGLGCPMPVEVMASMNTTFGAYAPPGVTYTADDSPVAMIRFENGIMLCMEGAFETDQFLQARADEVVTVDLPQPDLPNR